MAGLLDTSFDGQWNRLEPLSPCINIYLPIFSVVMSVRCKQNSVLANLLFNQRGKHLNIVHIGKTRASIDV